MDGPTMGSVEAGVGGDGAVGVGGVVGIVEGMVDSAEADSVAAEALAGSMAAEASTVEEDFMAVVVLAAGTVEVGIGKPALVGPAPLG